MAQAIGQATVAGQGLAPVEAAHVGLVWRVARMAIYLGKGGTVETFVDVDPWDPVDHSKPPAQAQGQASKHSGLKEKGLKTF